jgi:hypothetical protein
MCVSIRDIYENITENVIIFKNISYRDALNRLDDLFHTIPIRINKTHANSVVVLPTSKIYC